MLTIYAWVMGLYVCIRVLLGFGIRGILGERRENSWPSSCPRATGLNMVGAQAMSEQCRSLAPEAFPLLLPTPDGLPGSLLACTTEEQGGSIASSPTFCADAVEFTTFVERHEATSFVLSCG